MRTHPQMAVSRCDGAVCTSGLMALWPPPLNPPLWCASQTTLSSLFADVHLASWQWSHRGRAARPSGCNRLLSSAGRQAVFALPPVLDLAAPETTYTPQSAASTSMGGGPLSLWVSGIPSNDLLQQCGVAVEQRRVRRMSLGVGAGGELVPGEAEDRHLVRYRTQTSFKNHIHRKEKTYPTHLERQKILKI